ncbi:pleckstrin homology domain-containing family G member 1 isoform X2 [Pangasianodon hypophthalmus]|nr:pleckstrin homology domain-containing family G member 1 isoform X2 [Pangasianodon hypophthalmus]XP_034167723.2 pleckstrin homology domain-containing family G member 1 isoform X2 [Pangasianodon hypophthalmus]XP_034167724.2 pleckstrin homology domain-containing family G member 1 isoform X2 [Pangasianodon hypophthalmus]XP_034167725.2 pleckstrin homology domain-containing family G member 1 isoform X2 [Pangasianodon hypophthalmus]
MDSAQCNDRPVSYTSTSSSASSSRDSHCSAVLGSAPERDRDSGAIRLELVPARQLEEAEPPAPTSQDEERKVAYVDHVVQEILETERTYVQDLQSIVQDYLECISNQARPMLGLEDRNSLFGNIREIYCFNRDLLHDLEKCNADPVAIAQCFVAKSEEFHIYTQYCTNYPRSVAVLSDCMRNKAVAKFLRERQECAKHSLPLGSFLLKPVQRILKYHLLLHEIATHLEKDSERHAVVQEAIDTMQRVAWHINDMKRKHENTVRLQEIQSLLTNWQGPDLIGYGELVLEGTFRVQRVKNERTFFLFDKLLLITKKREETYAYKAHILCCNLMLVEVIPKEPLSFSVFHYKNPKLQHTVQAKSQQDKRTWIQHLKRLILENHPAKIPAKAKQAILDMDVHQCSPEGQNRINLKEGPSPRRARRKTEPLSKLLKNKHAISSPDIQKRSSFGATLLSPVVHLGTIGRSRSLVSQSQESLDPGDHGDHSDIDEGLHPQDADDEDDSGLSSGGKLRVPGKNSRKRLNAQVSVDSIDHWKNHSLDHIDLQTAKESLQKETVHTPILRVTCPPETRADDHFSQLLGTSSGRSVPNIWADHRVRRAMFPTRQKTVQIDDDEDIYQMFVPTENDTSGHDAESDHDTIDDRPGRPCSWHVEQTQSVQLDLPANRGKVLRRASSVGEQQSERQSPTKRAVLKEEVHDNTESSSNEISGSSSAEQLTIDDIENVYDNISYEELQAMGLIRKDPEVNPSSSEMKPVVPPQILVSPVEMESSSESNRSSGQEGAPFESSYVQTPEEEENVYDTIVFRELPPPVTEAGRGTEQAAKQDNAQSPKTDVTVIQNIGTVVFDERPNLDYSKVANRPLPEIPTVSVTDMDIPLTLDKPSKQSVADHMSEQVDEIWNDLENYIRNNEKKADKLPAAFPVNRPESPRKMCDSQGKIESSSDKLHSSPTKAVKSQPKSQDSQDKTRKSHQSPSKKCNSGRKTSDSHVKTDGAKKVKKSASSPCSPAFHPIPTFKFPVLSVPKLVREPTFEIDEPESPPSTPPSTPSIPQVPTTAPQVPTTAAQVPTTAPQVPTTAPQVPTTAPQVPAAQVPTTAAQVSTTAAQVPTTAAQVPTTAPQVPTTAPQVPTTAPQVPTTAPQVSTPAPQVSTPAPQVSTTAPQVSNPASQVSTSVPQVQVSSPVSQVSSPFPQVSSPVPQVQVSSPFPQVSSPVSQVSSPIPQVQVSSNVSQVSSPSPQVSSPSPQVSSPIPQVQFSSPIPEIQVSSPEPPPGTVKSIRNKLARLSSGSFRMDDEDPPTQKDPELQALFSGLDPSLLPLASSGLLLGADAGDQLLDLGEKGRNRVFLMARQYSQKIKKANQLLKMKSMDHEPSCARLRTNKAKDLAAILEEKKQGGAAIGARIAEYSQLYEHVMFKEPPTTPPVLKSSVSVSGPHPFSSRSGLASSPSLPESAFPETDWLNCTYSNGELAGFVSWPDEVGGRSSTPQRKLSPAMSIPAFKNLPPPPSTPSNQRWSACVTPASKDDSEHIYSTLGQRSFKTPPYTRCQSSSSLAEQQEKENGGSMGNLGHTSHPEGAAIAGRGLGPRQHSLPECPAQTTSDLSQSCDLTLRDSQQVLVLNRQSNLNAISATQNYLANFKDNGDDDDDYVEIRSEDESDGIEKGCTASPDSALHGYIWNDPSDSQQALNQPKIVQSLREKFQCLGSSSFA